MKTIKITLSNAMEAIVFVDKITHIKSNKQLTYVCMGSESLATNMKAEDVLALINS